jgi:beta-N-acetylhexosaminidase
MYPALDPAHPATLSRRILTDLLRGELGFGGIAVSDDLGMRAVADRWPIEEIVVEGLLAGIDVFLMRGPVARQVAAFEALVRAAEMRSEVRARIEEYFCVDVQKLASLLGRDLSHWTKKLPERVRAR